ncbi:MAG: replicative DNA helicase [Firmicutes bacterium]|nr:replicative DNA helicase [Bacillota bacterium]
MSEQKTNKYLANQASHPNTVSKKPPQNNEAEQAVLGCILIDSNAADKALYALKEGDFYLKAHQTIFAAMKNLSFASRPIDIVTIVQELDVLGKTEEIGGLNYLSFLTNTIPTAANHKHYTDIVKNNSLRRNVIFTTEEIAAEGYKGERDDILSFAESKIFSLGEDAARKDLTPISDAIILAYERMELIDKDKNAFKGVTTGFDLLDGYLNGFQNGDLIVLAARPGHGKTSLGMNFILNAAMGEVEKIKGIKSKTYAAVFSLEMPSEQLARRMLCSFSKVSMSRAASGNLQPSEWARLRQHKPILDEAQIYIDDTSAITPAEIISKCRRLKREKRLDIVMIDYLQLMSSGKRQTENRQQEISDITRTMKIAAKELNVPIIMLSQLSRKVEERKDKQPMMSDLRESGAIEQDADIIMFIQKPVDSDIAAGIKEDAYKLIIAKHRNGELGMVPLKWKGEYVTFENDFEGNPAAQRSAEIKQQKQAQEQQKKPSPKKTMEEVLAEDDGELPF